MPRVAVVADLEYLVRCAQQINCFALRSRITLRSATTNRAANSRSPFTMIIPRARTPALMLAAAANATATPAPASLHRFTNGFSRLAFRWQRARYGHRRLSDIFRSSSRFQVGGWFSALSGVELLVAIAPRRGLVGHTSGSVTEGRETSSGQVQHYVPGFTEPTLVLVPRTKYQHGSASARCLIRHFPPAPIAAAFRSTDFAGCSRSFRQSQIAETGMDSGGHSRWRM